jgi:hypothetical protein
MGPCAMKQQQANSFREIARTILASAEEATTEGERNECLLLALFYEQSACELEQRVKERLH